MHEKVVAITGADGFIGGRLAARFPNKWIGIKTAEEIEHAENLAAVFHLAAITDTMHTDQMELIKINVQWPKELWNACTKKGIPFIYASSASVYGNGDRGFSEETDVAQTLGYCPLNYYAESKRALDAFILQDHAAGARNTPPRWYGMRFFNVYGAEEAHKGRMASIVHQLIKQVALGATPKLFEGSGEARRDFVYVEDCVSHMINLFENEKAPSGIYNSGYGEAYSLFELCGYLSVEFECVSKIQWIPFPDELKTKYQWFTRAKMRKMYHDGGYKGTPTTLRRGIEYTVKTLRRLGEIA
jgi:ADP-L-glycero-D-manno-heptose 6-epimerase